MPEPIVVVDAALDPTKFILEGIDVSREPIFTVGEVAKVFFGRSAHWIRWRERKGYFDLDGEPVGDTRTSEGARRYNLADIEKMAHALASKGAITGSQLRNALMLVQTEARVYGYIV